MPLLNFGDFNSNKQSIKETENDSWRNYDENHTIVGVEWRAAGKFGTVGFVAVKNNKMNYWMCMLGMATGHDDKADAVNIAQWGSIQPQEEALAYFPNMDKLTYQYKK